MLLLLRTLGFCAFVSDRLSRISVRGVPANWVAIVFLLVGVGAATDLWKDAHLNGARPQVMSVPGFSTLANTRFAHWYVRVDGVVLPRVRLSVEKKVGDRPTYDLVAFLDERGREGIWLKTAPGQYAGQQPFRARIEGLMGRASSDFETHLVEGVPQVGSALMHREAWLEAGNKPFTVFWPAFSFVACSLVSVLLIGLSLARNIIFWPQNVSPVAPKALAPNEEIALGVSGKLRKNAKVAGRFLNVPAQTMNLEDGTLALSATVDPTREPGARVKEQPVGEWLLVPGGEFSTRAGVLAYRGKLYPSLKMEFRDSLDKGRRATAILSCEDEATRAALLARLDSSQSRVSAFQPL